MFPGACAEEWRASLLRMRMLLLALCYICNICSHMARSSTMPLKGELGGSSGELRGGPASNGYLGSISSLAGSGLKTLAGR